MTQDQPQSSKVTGERKLRLVQGGGLKLIETEAELFQWLFQQLAASKPQVSISSGLWGRITAFRQEVVAKGTVRSAPAYFDEIMAGIHWCDVPADAQRCGLKLLRLLGSLSQAMIVEGGDVRVPCSRVIEMMLFLAEDELPGLDPKYRRLVTATAAFEAKHRVKVRVKLPRRTRYEEIWDLSDITDKMLARALRKAGLAGSAALKGRGP